MLTKTTLRGHSADHRVEIGCRDVGTRQIEPGRLAVEAAMPEQDDGTTSSGAAAWRTRERLVDFLARGATADVRRVPSCLPLVTSRSAGTPTLADAAAGDPTLKQLAVLGVARQADDDQEKRSKHHESPTARR